MQYFSLAKLNLAFLTHFIISLRSLISFFFQTLEYQVRLTDSDFTFSDADAISDRRGGSGGGETFPSVDVIERICVVLRSCLALAFDSS